VSKGLLISFEGLDGAGKTTQIDLLEAWLKKRRVPYVRTREPGGTALGIQIRDLLLNHPELAITPFAEAFLFQADRAQHFAQVILPALEEGKLVITDRCFDASIAYQGYARGVGVKLVEELSLLATQGHKPNLTILLDLNPEQVHTRVGIAHEAVLPSSEAALNSNGLREKQDRFDSEAEKFHQLVRKGFLDLAEAYPERIKVIDASQSIPEVHQKIVELVSALLKAHPLQPSSSSMLQEGQV
jgi:dTMP kinase